MFHGKEKPYNKRAINTAWIGPLVGGGGGIRFIIDSLGRESKGSNRNPFLIHDVGLKEKGFWTRLVMLLLSTVRNKRGVVKV